MDIIPDSTTLAQLGDEITFAVWEDDNTTSGKAPTTPAVLSVVPKDRLVTAVGDIDVSGFSQTTRIAPVCNVTSNGIVKIIVSTDSGKTWKTRSSNTWVGIEATPAAVKASGMLPATVDALTSQDILDMLNGATTIKFAYLLSIADTADTANADKLSITGQQQGIWWDAVPGFDFTSCNPYKTTIRVMISKDTSGFPNGKTDFKINY